MNALSQSGCEGQSGDLNAVWTLHLLAHYVIQVSARAALCRPTWNPQLFTKLWLLVKKSLARVPVGQSWLHGPLFHPTHDRAVLWLDELVLDHWEFTFIAWLIFFAHFTLYLLTISDTLDSGQLEGTRASSVHLTSSVVCHLLIGNLQEFNFSTSPLFSYQVQHS